MGEANAVTGEHHLPSNHVAVTAKAEKFPLDVDPSATKAVQYLD